MYRPGPPLDGEKVGRDGRAPAGCSDGDETGSPDPDPVADNPSAGWPLHRRPGFLVRRLHQIHISLFMKACAEFEITPLQYSILSALTETGAALDQTTLANAVALDRTTTTGIVKRLHARGLVARSTAAHDRRAQACSLRPAGAALLRRMDAAVRKAHRETLAPLSDGDQALLIELMGRIVTMHDGCRDDAPLPL